MNNARAQWKTARKVARRIHCPELLTNAIGHVIGTVSPDGDACSLGRNYARAALADMMARRNGAGDPESALWSAHATRLFWRSDLADIRRMRA